jgi:hypothetical protein
MMLIPVELAALHHSNLSRDSAAATVMSNATSDGVAGDSSRLIISSGLGIWPGRYGQNGGVP